MSYVLKPFLPAREPLTDSVRQCPSCNYGTEGDIPEIKIQRCYKGTGFLVDCPDDDRSCMMLYYYGWERRDGVLTEECEIERGCSELFYLEAALSKIF